MDVSEMLSTFTNHGFDSSIPDTEKMLAINDTLWEIEGMEPWPFLTKSASLNTNGVSATPTNMPADFKAVVWMQDLVLGLPIWPQRVESIRAFQANTAGTTLVTDPQAFYFVGSTLNFWPIPPSATGRYQMDYLAVQTKLTTSSVESAILMPPRYHRAIVLGAMARLFAEEDDLDEAVYFTGLYEKKIQQMRYDLFKQQYMQPDKVFVTDQDDTYENYPY